MSEASLTPSLSRDLGIVETIVELGMTHPAVRRSLPGSTLGFIVQLDDDRVTGLEVEIGLGHRGFEKEAESTPWHRAVAYASRLGHASGLSAEMAWCGAVEGLAKVWLPDRAIWSRTLVCELARVSDHFARLAAVTAALELPLAAQAARRAQAGGLDLLDFATGRRVPGCWSRLGGIASALPSEFGLRWQRDGAEFEELLARFEILAVRNPTCISRLRDVAPLSAEDCLAWGVSGPALRAAGIPSDRRRDAPYLGYASLDFDVPIGETGDDYDRLLVVVEEVRQSLRLVDQCWTVLDGLPPGPINVDDEAWPARGTGTLATPDDSREFEALLEGPPVPAGAFSFSVESSTGELGFFIVSDGEGLPRRVRCRAPSFFHAQALPAMLNGARLDDVLPTAALMHLVSPECDR